ncbi:MAG: sugar phosphate nucleotidyltransferase [Euryarchaeota archaeon]|nr:sugar phosphate nucleotidyltransferase [Euryarchaeota archaeon]
MKAVILAAGKGTRMQPLTNTRAKLMLPIANKPVIEHVIRAVINADLRDIFLVVGYRKEQIIEYLKNRKLPAQISFIEQEQQLGTAHAVSIVKNKVKDEPFVVINGDILVKPSIIIQAVKTHQEKKASATLTLVEVEDPSSYGVVKIEQDGEIKKIVEKPKASEAPSNFANAGLYVFSSDIFDAIEKTTKSTRGELEITASIQNLINWKKRVYGLFSKDYWMEISKPWDLLRANQVVLKKIESQILGNIEERATLKGPVQVGDGTTIRNGAYTQGPVVIGENCDIGPNCYIRPYTSIGNKVRIGNAVEVKNSIIMDYAHIGHLSYIGDSIIGEKCNFGAGTKIANLRFDEGPIQVKIKEQLENSKLRKFGAIIGDNVKTGIGVLINPGIKIGSNARIGPGIVVYEDVEPGALLLLDQKIIKK